MAITITGSFVTASSPAVAGWVRNVLTFQDCYERAVNFLRAFGYDMQGVTTGPPELLRGVIIDAYETVLNSYDWPALEGMGRINIEAYQTTGTVTYTSASRQLVLSGASWPSWVEGSAVRIGDYTHQVQTYVDSATVVLDEQLSPSANVAAGTSYELWRWWYPLPRNFGNLTHIIRYSGVEPNILTLPEIQRRYQWSYGTSEVTDVAIGRHPLKIGQQALYIGAPCTADDSLDITYTLRPRDLRFAGYDTNDSVGTVSVTADSNSVTGTTTAFTDEMEDAMLRWGRTSARPTGTHGSNRYAEQQVILSVESATALTLMGSAVTTRSTMGYVVTDPLMIDPSAYNAVLREIEAQLALTYRSGHYGSYRNAADQALRLGIQGSLSHKMSGAVRRWRIGDGVAQVADEAE